MPQPHSHRPVAARVNPTPGRLALGLLLCLIALAGCSGSPSDDDLSSATTTLSGRDGGTGSVDGGGSGSADDDGLDRSTAADDRSVLGPDGPPAVEQPELASPAERLDTMRGAEVTAAIIEAAASPDVAILDVAGIIDDGPTAEEIAAFGDGNTRGPTGELIILDEQASLACADIEIALGDIDAGRTSEAVAHVGSAAERSGRSTVDGISAWSAALGASANGSREQAGKQIEGRQGDGIDAVTLVGFLSVCVDGGYVL